MIQIKRVYEKPETSDGFRILVDRLWPRGLSRDSAKIDRWLKDIAPSDELRKWFSHDPAKWEEFLEQYHTELQAKEELIRTIRTIEEEKGTVTLLYAAKDTEHNNAAGLQKYLQKNRT